jgi:hypothetical protein
VHRSRISSLFVVSGLLLATPPAHGQSTSTALVVTATVVSSCRVEVPRSAEASTFATMPIAVTCARGATTPRVQRPLEPRRIEVRDALLIIDF